MQSPGCRFVHPGTLAPSGSAALSLTSELKQKDSFARRFIDHHFPHLAALSRARNIAMRAHGFQRLPHSHEHKVISMLVGTAVDYRVRAYFDQHVEKAGTVMRGLTILCNLKLEKPHIDPETKTNIKPLGKGWHWEEFEVVTNPWYWRRRKRIAERLVASFGRFVAKARPERRKLSRQDEERLCRYCVLFAYLDWIGRSDRSSALEILIRLGSPQVRSMLRSVDTKIVADVVAISSRFYEKQRGLLKKFKHIVVGGTFAGSPDVGGADFDLVVDACLIDLKATLNPRMDTTYLRQLVGYWLLDYEDALSIRAATIILARHGHSEHFEMGELIGSNANAAALRSAFRSGLQSPAATDSAGISFSNA